MGSGGGRRAAPPRPARARPASSSGRSSRRGVRRRRCRSGQGSTQCACRATACPIARPWRRANSVLGHVRDHPAGVRRPGRHGVGRGPRPGGRPRARCCSTSSRARSTGPTSCSARATTRRRPGRRTILGLECAGRIAALGEGVTGWSVGDEVCALLAGGGYAQKVAVPAAQLLPAPEGVDLVTAAGLPEVACTVWSNVVAAGRLEPGETFLVQGGTSGIGTHAIQVAKALGARVAATASPQRADRCRELGADIVIDYHDDVPAELKKATDGHGADVILDNMGARGPRRERRRAGRRRPAAGHRHAGRHHGRAEPQHAAAQARQHHGDEPARATGRRSARQGCGRGRRAGAGVADGRRRAGAADRARDRPDGPRPPMRTGSWRPAAWWASCCWRCPPGDRGGRRTE